MENIKSHMARKIGYDRDGSCLIGDVVELTKEFVSEATKIHVTGKYRRFQFIDIPIANITENIKHLRHRYYV